MWAISGSPPLDNLCVADGLPNLRASTNVASRDDRQSARRTNRTLRAQNNLPKAKPMSRTQPQGSHPTAALSAVHVPFWKSTEGDKPLQTADPTDTSPHKSHLRGS